MSATRHGSVLLAAKHQQKLPTTRSRCEFLLLIQSSEPFTSPPFSLAYAWWRFRSANITVEGSVGLVGTSDPVYTSLPPDSRKPPAPIDPTSKLVFFLSLIHMALTDLHFLLQFRNGKPTPALMH